MTLPFAKFFVPAVKLETADGTTIINNDGQGLRLTWNIERDNTNNPDFGEITVYNLAPKTSKKIHEAWRSSGSGNGSFVVVFSLGWDKVSTRVFVGDVWDLVPNRREPADVLTVFQVGDGVKPTRDSTVGRSFHDVKIDVLLEFLVALPPADSDVGGGGLGLEYPKESKTLIKQAVSELSVTPSFGNIPSGLNTKDTIDRIMDTIGLEWRVHNNKFIAMRGGIIVGKPGPLIQPKSGLLDFTPTNDGGIEFTALAQASVEPGIQLVVANDEGVPFGEKAYRVDRVQFSGDTIGESLMFVEARKVQLL